MSARKLSSFQFMSTSTPTPLPSHPNPSRNAPAPHRSLPVPGRPGEGPRPLRMPRARQRHHDAWQGHLCRRLHMRTLLGEGGKGAVVGGRWVVVGGQWCVVVGGGWGRQSGRGDGEMERWWMGATEWRRSHRTSHCHSQRPGLLRSERRACKRSVSHFDTHMLAPQVTCILPCSQRHRHMRAPRITCIQSCSQIDTDACVPLQSPVCGPLPPVRDAAPPPARAAVWWTGG